MRAAIASILLLVACGSRNRADPTPPRPLGYAAHMEKAAEHDRRAASHQEQAEVARPAPDTWTCDNNPATAQSTSGTERLTVQVPCWSIEQEASERHRREAERLRAEARQHRAIARTLVEVERTFCAGIGDDEMTHTPFWHRDDIATVARYDEGGALRGARVTFAPIKGLSADWLRQAVLCHRARAATLGYQATYMAYDPTVLHRTHVAIEGDPRRGLVVTIRADDADTAAVVWSRAQALKQPSR